MNYFHCSQVVHPVPVPDHHLRVLDPHQVVEVLVDQNRIRPVAVIPRVIENLNEILVQIVVRDNLVYMIISYSNLFAFRISN